MPISKGTSKQEELLGSDVALDGSGNFMVTYRSGFRDIATIRGIANLKQALLSRCLSTPKMLGSRRSGSLPAHPQYGVGAVGLVSAPMTEALQQLRTQLILNLNAEARIKPLIASNISFETDVLKRQLLVTVTFTPISDQIPQNLIFPIYIK